MLEPVRVAVDYRLEPFSLAQMSSAVDGKRAPGNVVTAEEILDQINDLFFTRRDFHQRFVEGLFAVLRIIAFIK